MRPWIIKKERSASVGMAVLVIIIVFVLELVQALSGVEDGFSVPSPEAIAAAETPNIFGLDAWGGQRSLPHLPRHPRGCGDCR